MARGASELTERTRVSAEVSVGAPLLPGAHPYDGGTRFVVRVTGASVPHVRLFEAGDAIDDASPMAARFGLRVTRTLPLEPAGVPGLFALDVRGASEGDLYAFVVSARELPDPYARSLPFGVHGPARVVAKAREPALAAPPAPHRWVVYELHVGAFTAEGTFAAAAGKLDHLVALGITAVELLPVSAFAGERGWGYDGVALFAPHPAYGELDDLRAFVRAAHARGLAVILDVVYNHLGPSGNYLASYADDLFLRDVTTPWGEAPDFGPERGPGSMRALVLENVRFWLEELGFDGLRLDATHSFHDASERHVLREIVDLAHAMTPPRRVFFEDDRNDVSVFAQLGADAVWSEDLGRQAHAVATGERDGHYGAFEPTVAALARAVTRGWVYEGSWYPPWGVVRGTPLVGSGVGPERLVYALQNHDGAGNRAEGERLASLVSEETFLALTALQLFLPATPLLFMGQEWAAQSPFLFFCDHDAELGEAIRRGRAAQLATLDAFADPVRRARVPDPQARETFERSKLRWSELGEARHARAFEVHAALLALRRDDAVLGAPSAWDDLAAEARGDLLVVTRRRGGASRVLAVNLGAGPAVFEAPSSAPRVLMTIGAFARGSLAASSVALLASAD